VGFLSGQSRKPENACISGLRQKAALFYVEVTDLLIFQRKTGSRILCF